MQEKEIILDATDAVLGRIAAYAAKQALQGSRVTLVNCEKAIIIGNKQDIIENYRHMRQRGTTEKGPFVSRDIEKLFKRTIRGMLPYKKTMGREALKRVRCYIKNNGKDSNDENAISLEQFKKTTKKHISIEDVCKLI